MTKQYPQQTGTYLVKVSARQSTDHWQDFNTARLQISVGQEYHEGDKFSSLINWCKGRFDKLVICVNDTLQRFNIMFEELLEEELAENRAIGLGREWIDRVRPIISGIEDVSLVRWNEWKANKEFTKGRLSTEWLYSKNNEFRGAIDSNIEAIWKRRKSVKSELYKDKGFENFQKLSRQYLLEETAVFSMMYEKEKAIDIYPGTTLFAATLFKDRNVYEALVGLGKGHFCRIDFKKNRSFGLN
ncbi:MAG: tRNA-dependent cyclodipeptide synthase [Reichenbachiella sp.]|uniref:tRNA-dependent cyclodipeptide synthase n=1 Tax=Reichenbachiella sp. TaxID=2184521 RepID=UPI003263F5DE